jgi:hypothetical protein
LTGKRTLETTQAVRVAGNAAECFKAAGGDVRETTRLLGVANVRNISGETASVYYNENWNLCDEETASYVLQIAVLDNPAPHLTQARLSISRVDGDELFDLVVTARGYGG